MELEEDVIPSKINYPLNNFDLEEDLSADEIHIHIH